jgi:gtrA family integral membrane protein
LKTNKNVLQFLKFLVVGVLNTIIFLVVYYSLLNLGVNYIVSNISGFLVSILNAYLLNSKYVFLKNNNAKNFLKVFMVYGTTTILSTFLLYLMVDIIKISDKIAPLINLCITTPTNFYLNKFWAFN